LYETKIKRYTKLYQTFESNEKMSQNLNSALFRSITFDNFLGTILRIKRRT